MLELDGPRESLETPRQERPCVGWACREDHEDDIVGVGDKLDGGAFFFVVYISLWVRRGQMVWELKRWNGEGDL